jgi:anti-sigma regulatory factor (Ser/Thr protein kinase)
VCENSAAVRLTLPSDERAPALARKLLKETQYPVHYDAVLDEFELLVSEVVTNAVRHGVPPITIEVTCEGDAGLVVRVSDGSTVSPLVHNPTAEDESGRGLALVDVISDAWGVEPTDTGKQVWFQFRQF